jgi:hypothetical protein
LIPAGSVSDFGSGFDLETKKLPPRRRDSVLEQLEPEKKF